MSEAIELHPYDSAWPAAFERERVLLASILGNHARLIEHMGSTAVPGLAAKPIIDIIVLVDDLKSVRPLIPALEATGYSFWADNPDRTKLFLARGLPPAPQRTHHLHVYVERGEVERHLSFRDRLRADARVRDAYQALKQELARRFRNDREAYTSHKTGFVEQVVNET